MERGKGEHGRALMSRSVTGQDMATPSAEWLLTSPSTNISHAGSKRSKNKDSDLQIMGFFTTMPVTFPSI